MNPPPLPNDATVIEKVRSGQKMIVWGILLMVISFIIGRIYAAPLIAIISGLMGLAAIVASILGLLRVTGGLGYNLGLKILLILLTFVPLVGLIALLIVNSNATSYLKRSGHAANVLGNH